MAEKKQLNEEQLEKVDGGIFFLNDEPTEPGYWYKLAYQAKWRTVDAKGGYATSDERDTALEHAKVKAINDGGFDLYWTVGYNA